MSLDHGRIDGLPNSDEAARDNRSTRGSETCGIVEGLLSTEIAQKILGEAWLGDRIEQLAYNALPAAYTPDLSGHTYYVLQNQVMATLGNHEFDCDHGDSSAFGAPLGFDCCFANCHMGWPKFVQNMWMATADNGLALVAYGPNRVTAKVADGKTATFVQETNYPFEDAVHLSYSGETAEFELKLRIPEWCDTPEVSVNGEEQEGVVTGEYYTIQRDWQAGDEIDLNFPSEIETSTWYNDSIAVEKGPLIYGLKIEEDWRTYDSNDARELKVEHQEQSPLREVFPASRWNYGLIVDEDDPASSFTIEKLDEVPLQPFSTENAPIVLKAKGQIIPEWQLDGNIAGPQPFGPTPYDESLVEDIELIPYGCGRLRITHFPKIGEAQETVVRTAERDAEIVKDNGVTYQEFDNVIVPAANNYTLHVRGNGVGSVVINGKYTQEIDLSTGSATITDLKNLLSGGFRFDAEQYNNIRFTDGVTVDEIEVVPVERSITEVQINSTRRSGDSIKLVTNLDPQETPYRVVYGTESGVYTHTVRGFSSNTATLTGLDTDETYYVKVIAPIMGQEVESAEMAFEPASEGGLKPNPNVPTAVYNGFNSLNYMEQDWKLYDPNGKVSLRASADGSKTEIRFEKDPDVKAVLNLADADKWVDFVAEAELSVDLANNNNCGLILRGTNIGEGPDNYQGYFVGIGRLDVKNLPETGEAYNGPGVMIGYADGAWHDLKPIRADIQPGETYRLKVVVYGNQFAVYLNDELLTTFEDDRFANGTIGLRSYNEAFTVYNTTVRPVEEDDLTVFETGEEGPSDWPPYVEANLVDDFSNMEESNARWTKVGDADRIQIEDGKMSLGSSTDIKATAGDDTWSNFAYEVNLKLLDGGGNSGIIFRTTNEGPGADNYYGYYFGISGTNFEIGKASNGWTSLRNENYELDTSIPHTLKVLVHHDRMLFYIDDKQVANLTDTTHQTGKIGLRGYNRAFEVNHVTVRPLTDKEIEELETQTVEVKEVTADSSYNVVRVNYPKTSNATSFKALVGTESGVYTDEFVDFFFNGYKGSGIFSADKTAFSVPENGTYYVKFMGMNGTTPVMTSEEIVITTNDRADTADDCEKLAEILAQAKATDTTNFTQTSLERLERAIADAEALPEDASQMAIGVAKNILYAAMTTPNSEDIPDEPVIPSEHTLTVSYPTTVKLSIDGEEQTIANLIGAYKDVVMANTNLDLTFEPRVEGREIAGVTVNGEAVAEENFDVAEYIYSLAMPNADTTIELGFTIVDKENLREVITIAESENVKAQVEAAVPSVQKKYENALQAAKAIEEKKTASQDEINNAMFELIEALQYLSFTAGDKSQLEIPMEIAESINRENFTPESVKALDDAYKAAEDLMDDEEVLEADIQAAAEALYEALDNLVFRADRTDLEALVAEGKKIVENASKYIQDETWTTFETILGDAETLLENDNATQEAVDEKAEELLNAITALRMIPNKDALKDLIGKAEAVNTSKYTAKSVAAMQKALSNAKVVLNNEAATEEEVKSAVEALEASIQNLETKTTIAKKSGSTSRNVSNTYGAAGVVSASQSAAASVRSDAANAITLNRGSMYTFKMTVVNGNGLAPSFTVGNGSVLKTQFVSQIGNDYYYRVYAVGTPGQSTGVYTTLPGQNAELHCTVTVG